MIGRVRALAAARRARDDAVAVDAVAGLAERLAVLLAAGVAAPAAWRHLAADAPGDPVLEAAAGAAADGEPVAAALAREARDTDAAKRAGGGRLRNPASRGASPADAGAWAALAAAWAVASESGAPLASSLRELAGALRDDAQLRREVRAALAGPRASAKLVTTLPLVAVGFGLLLGFDTAGVLFGNPLGWACLVIGGSLLWAGARWNRALASRAAPPTASPGLELDLLAIAMSSGASVDGAMAVTGRAIAEHVPSAAPTDTVWRDAASTVGLATKAGAPIADLLRAEAYRQRRVARAEGAVRAAALSVRLMIPLGVCILPAFVLLGVAPLMISVLTGTLGGAR
jgi:tight adherence protein B